MTPLYRDLFFTRDPRKIFQLAQADRIRIVGCSLRNITLPVNLGVRKGLQVLERTMFHEVKILDKKRKVKKVLSSKKLSKDYWNSFFKMGESIQGKGKKGKQKEPNIGGCDDENLSSDT